MARRSPPKAPPQISDPKVSIWWRAGVIALSGFFAYSNSLAGPFIFDDQLAITQNEQIREWWRLGSALWPERESPTAGRPLVNLSFAINYGLGGLSVVGYHVVNVLLHVLCGLLVFGIVRRTYALPGVKPSGATRSTNFAFAVALLWTLHPLNTEAVNYLTQRTELMMALCYLLTLYAGIRAWQSVGSNRWYAIAVASCVAGMASKESMVTAPLMVMVYDGVFLFDSWGAALRRRWRFYTGLALSWIVLGALMWSGPRAHSAGFSSGFSPWTYLLNQTVVITGYLRHSVWPNALVLNYGWPDPLTLGAVLPYAGFIGMLLAVTVVALIRWPHWGILGAWFFLTLAPTSSVVPIATEVAAERRMYLPLIGLVVLGVLSVSRIARVRPAMATIALVACATALGIATLVRNGEYASELQLARTVVARHPTSVAHHVLGVKLMEAGQDGEAIAELRQALPGAPRAHYALAVELLKQGELEEATDHLQAFVREQPLLLEAVSARRALGEAFAKQERWPEAIEQYRMVLTMNPPSVERSVTQYLLGKALYATEHYDEAVIHYAEYVKARPNDADGLNNLAVTLVAAGRLNEAIGVFRRAVDVDPDNGFNQRNLANALFDHGDIEQAAVQAQRAVVLQPADPAAHDLLGRAWAATGRLQEARGEFERALQIAPGDPEAGEAVARMRRFPVAR